jgi:hypothetical protein
MEPGGGAHRYFRDLLQCLNAELQPTLISLPSESLTPEIERMAHESGACAIPIQMKSRWDFSTLGELRRATRKHQIRHANLQLSSLFWGNKTTFAALRMEAVKHLAMTAREICPFKERSLADAGLQEPCGH